MTEALGERFELSLLANCANRDKYFNPDGEHVFSIPRTGNGVLSALRRIICAFLRTRRTNVALAQAFGFLLRT